jgi:RHS repeat-associated protein
MCLNEPRSVDTLEPISNANQLEHFGFTGHEEDGELGLVNMRGRLYDPKLGRFPSADPFVQNPRHSQSWNRYSYIQNSPLNGTDPSGFLCDALNSSSACEPLGTTLPFGLGIVAGLPPFGWSLGNPGTSLSGPATSAGPSTSTPRSPPPTIRINPAQTVAYQVFHYPNAGGLNSLLNGPLFPRAANGLPEFVPPKWVTYTVGGIVMVGTGYLAIEAGIAGWALTMRFAARFPGLVQGGTNLISVMTEGPYYGPLVRQAAGPAATGGGIWALSKMKINISLADETAALTHNFAEPLGGNLGETVGPASKLTHRAVIRAAIEDYLGESLDGYEYFLQGTLSEHAADFTLKLGQKLFTAVDPKVARIFAERTVAKAGGGETGIVALVLRREYVDKLRSLGLLIREPIPDMPQHLQFVFAPGAQSMIENRGWFVTLPKGSFL